MAISIIGTPAAAAATTITLPTHAAGDIIIIYAYKDGATTIPTVPAAGGTVPTWVTIDGPTGANTNAAVCVYAVAVANNHTSGTFTGATGLAVIVLRGQHSSPIGGHTQSGANGANTAVCPSITLSDSTGVSAILHFAGSRNVTAWGSAPAGYTTQASVATEVICLTKNVTTSDGTLNLTPTNAASGAGYRGQSVEILVAPTPIVQTAVATYEATSALAATKSEPYDGLLALAATKSEPLEGVVALTATRADAYEALVSLAATGSDPLEALLGLAGTTSDPYEALLALAATESGAYEALLSLGATRSDAYEALVGVTATSAGVWEGLLSLVASAPLPVDGEEGVSADKETTIAILALAPLASPPTFTDHILRVRARKANPTDMGSLRCWLYEGLTLRAGPHDIVLTDDFTTDPWQLDEADASTITDYGDLRVAIQGIADTGEDLTVEASWIELHVDGQDVTWESTLAVAVSIAQTAELPIEALLSLTTSHSEPYETLLTLARSTSDAWEANLGLAAVSSDPFEVLRSIAATGPSPFESLVSIATTSGLPLEMLLGVAASKSDPVETGLGIAASSVFPLSALKQIAATGPTAYETLLALRASVSDPYEALQGLAAFNRGPWDTDGTITAVTATALFPLDVLAGIAANPGLSYEAAVKIASPKLLQLDTLLSLTRSGVVPLEALVGLTAVSVLPWDTGGVIVVSIVAAPIEALAGRTSTINDPYEVVKNLATTRSTVAENLSGQTASVTVPIEAGEGVRVTLAEPYEALRMLAALGAAKIDSTVPLTQVAIIPAETLVGIKQTGEVPLEALVNLRVTSGLPWEVIAEVFEVLGRVFLSDSAVAIVTLIEGNVAGVTQGDALAIETAVSLEDERATDVEIEAGPVGGVELTIELADRES